VNGECFYSQLTTHHSQKNIRWITANCVKTPSQTIGPFFAYSLAAEQYGYAYNSVINGFLLNPEEEGERIYITGNVFDGKGNSIHDALIELWQADANGIYRSLSVNKKTTALQASDV
jgi:protocatechuate 3,4-dioxygenase beta subunit